MSTPDYPAFLPRSDHPALLPWMHRLWQDHRYVPMLSLPGGEGDRLPVERVFVPPPVQGEGGQASVEELLRDRRRVVLLGESGAGKSFYCRALIRGLSTRGRGPWQERLGELVPIPLGAEEMMAPVDGEELLLALWRRLPGWTEELEQIVPAMLDSGQALLVLDGWDEVDDPGRRAALALALAELQARHPRAAVLLTSRGWTWEEAPLPGFAELRLGRFVRGPAEALGRGLAAWWGREVPALGEVDTDLALPGRLVLLALLAAEGERSLPRTWPELLGRAQDRLLLGEGAPLSLKRRWLEELALSLHRGRVWGTLPRRLSREGAREILARVEAGGLASSDEEAQGRFLEANLRPGGLLIEVAGGIGFVHLDHQDWLAAGALQRRLGLGWIDPEEAQRIADEVVRMVLRSGGFGAVAMLFERLRLEAPELGDQLAVEVFRRREVPVEARRRIVGLAGRLGHEELVGWAAG